VAGGNLERGSEVDEVQGGFSLQHRKEEKNGELRFFFVVTGLVCYRRSYKLITTHITP